MLYISNAKSFKVLMEKNGYSRTQIKNHLWKYHFVFSYTLERTVLRGDNTFVKVNVTSLDEKLGKMKVDGISYRTSKVILDDLTAWDVLIRQYTNKKQNERNWTVVQLKVHDTALVDGFEQWIAPVGVLACPIAEANLQMGNTALKGIYVQLLDNLSCLEFDALGARNHAKSALSNSLPLRDKRVEHVLYRNRYVNKQVYSSWMNSINKIESRQWCATSDEYKTKRFFTTLHSTPAAIREFVTINGRKTVEVDISSSQCLMLAIMLKKKFSDLMPADVAKYIMLCETGTFYQHVQQLVGAQAMQREAFKAEFFGRIFYSSEKRRYKWRTLFANKFPNVSAFITLQKTGEDECAYKQFPVALSALESTIMLEGIAARLLAEGVTEFYTVHDAFYCTEDVRNRVEEVLQNVFAEYNVKAHVKERPQSVAPVSIAPFVTPTIVIDDFPAHLLAKLEAHFAGVDEQKEEMILEDVGEQMVVLSDEERLD